MPTFIPCNYISIARGIVSGWVSLFILITLFFRVTVIALPIMVHGSRDNERKWTKVIRAKATTNSTLSIKRKINKWLQLKKRNDNQCKTGVRFNCTGEGLGTSFENRDFLTNITSRNIALHFFVSQLLFSLRKTAETRLSAGWQKTWNSSLCGRWNLSQKNKVQNKGWSKSERRISSKKNCVYLNYAFKSKCSWLQMNYTSGANMILKMFCHFKTDQLISWNRKVLKLLTFLYN